MYLTLQLMKTKSLVQPAGKGINVKKVRRTRAAERAHLPPRNLNNEFNNAADPIFRTPIAAMTEATLLLKTMPQNPELERVINLTKNPVEQLER